MNGNGCKKCMDDSYKKSKEQFIFESNIKHNNLYDYSLVDYINSHIKIKIRCIEHNFVFEQKPYKHMNCKTPCSLCRGFVNNTTDFIKKSLKKHKGLYNYDQSNYINTITKVKIACKIHGMFEQLPGNHMKGQGCPKCGGTARLDTSEFIKRATSLHGGVYDYSISNYKSNTFRIDIICKEHGVFSQYPHSHLGGQGCSKCNSSSGELIIFNFLTEREIIFKTEYKFDELKFNKILRFDFAVFNENNQILFIIEYN